MNQAERRTRSENKPSPQMNCANSMCQCVLAGYELSFGRANMSSRQSTAQATAYARACGATIAWTLGGGQCGRLDYPCSKRSTCMEQYIAQYGDDMPEICDCPRLPALGRANGSALRPKGWRSRMMERERRPSWNEMRRRLGVVASASSAGAKMLFGITKGSGPC